MRGLRHRRTSGGGSAIVVLGRLTRLAPWVVSGSVRREGPLTARPGKPRLVDGASGPIHEWSEGGVALSEGKIVSELTISLGQGFELDRARRERGPRVRQFGERGDGSEDRMRESATEI
jgi:hypothetical protein